ncbi:hypothetical protein CR513_29199, partial [Mucuna pruriens]
MANSSIMISRNIYRKAITNKLSIDSFQPLAELLSTEIEPIWSRLSVEDQIHQSALGSQSVPSNKLLFPSLRSALPRSRETPKQHRAPP